MEKCVGEPTVEWFIYDNFLCAVNGILIVQETTVEF